jgi:release factor glutamine methyltransferase
VTSSELAGLQPEIQCHEPIAALDGGPDGLDAIRRLLDQAPLHLRGGGAIFLEIGAQQGPSAIELASEHLPQATVDVRQDLAGLDRVLRVLT